MKPGRSDDGKPKKKARFREVERRLEAYEAGGASSNPTWGEVRERLQERSALKGRGGGARRAGASRRKDAPVHDDPDDDMKEPPRRGPSGRGPSERREGRPRNEGEEPRRFAAPRGASADELLELAEELEDHARALMSQARRLQRLAGSAERAESARPPRPRGRPGGAPARGGHFRAEDRDDDAPRRPREDRPRKRADDEPRPRKRPGGAPDWAPRGKKRKS